MSVLVCAYAMVLNPPLCHLSYASLPLSSMQLVLWGRPRSAWMSWKALETGWCAMRSFLSCYSPKVVILMCGLKVVFCYVLLFRVCVCVCAVALCHTIYHIHNAFHCCWTKLVSRRWRFFCLPVVSSRAATLYWSVSKRIYSLSHERLGQCPYGYDRKRRVLIIRKVKI